MEKDNLPKTVDNKDLSVSPSTDSYGPILPKAKQPTLLERLRTKNGIIMLVGGLLLVGGVYYTFSSNDKVKLEAVYDIKELPEPKENNFMDCYNRFDAIVQNSNERSYDAVEARLYASKLATVQYNMLSEQLDKLDTPTKNNVDEMRNKVYNIGWVSIKGYDNNVVYYSNGPLTQKYFEKKLSYVRQLADVYKSMGYKQERIETLLGGSKGNYYGIRN